MYHAGLEVVEKSQTTEYQQGLVSCQYTSVCAEWTVYWRYEGGEHVADCYTSGVGCDTDTWRMYKTENTE